MTSCDPYIVQGVSVEGDKDGPEDLLRVALHPGLHVRYDRRSHKVALLIALHRDTATVQHQLGKGGDNMYCVIVRSSYMAHCTSVHF